MATNRAIVIQVRDTQALAKSKGGIAALAANYLPDTVNDQVYAEMKKKFGEALEKEHVDADIQVVDGSFLTGAKKAPGSSDVPPLLIGIGVGAGVTGLGFLMYNLIFRKR